jgi:hypothetical protein
MQQMTFLLIFTCGILLDVKGETANVKFFPFMYHFHGKKPLFVKFETENLTFSHVSRLTFHVLKGSVYANDDD